MMKVTRNGMLLLALNKTFVAAFSIRRPLTLSRMSTRPPNPSLSKRSMSSLSANVGSSSEALHTVVVHRNRQSAAFREGTQLIFGGSVAATFTEHRGESPDNLISIPMGSLVAVVVSRESSSKERGRKDSRGKKTNSNAPHHSFSTTDTTKHRDVINQSQLIGYGVYNPESMYRVRVLCHDTIHPILTKEIRSIRKQNQRGNAQSEEEPLQLILERKISDAICTRLALGLPSPDVTDTYRLVNGEGDGLSGLAVDILGGSTAIVMSSAAWCEIHRDTILSVLEQSLQQSYEDADFDIIWRNTPSRLKQDGYDVDAKSSSDEEKREVSVVATESSVKYLTYPYSDGQKTGFYVSYF